MKSPRHKNGCGQVNYEFLVFFFIWLCIFMWVVNWMEFCKFYIRKNEWQQNSKFHCVYIYGYVIKCLLDCLKRKNVLERYSSKFNARYSDLAELYTFVHPSSFTTRMCCKNMKIYSENLFWEHVLVIYILKPVKFIVDAWNYHKMHVLLFKNPEFLCNFWTIAFCTEIHIWILFE